MLVVVLLLKSIDSCFSCTTRKNCFLFLLFAAKLKFETKYLTEKLSDFKKQDKEQGNAVKNDTQSYSFSKGKHHSCLIKYNPL